ncbi:MAG TPA: SAM-dependent methyltransferase [Candidatus Binatia bacterium]|nr:SAM-dependent methyltransferase [Candidatus Binatia bacterium]
MTAEDSEASPPQPELRERIAGEIRRHGPIPFSRYMELCLYEPELGYYSRPRERFGKAGDFYTSSDVHAVFGRLLARQFEEMWRALDSPACLELIELGPGRGLFARDVLDWSAGQFPEFSRALHYSLVEQSAHLRAQLTERLAEHIGAGKCAVSDSPEAAVRSAGGHIIALANEFFDALPVEVIDHRGALRVGFAAGQFTESFVPPSAAENEFLDRYGVHPEDGERVEVPLASLAWMDRIADLFRARRGFALFIDYGYTREEQLAGRHRDTIMSYRRHTASASPYEAPGEQDITAHVNFTALRARAVERALEPLALLTQSQFLLGIGEETQFADAFEECRMPQERAKVALQLKHLISPAGMGETFQVLVMSYNVEKDRAARMSGLKLAH